MNTLVDNGHALQIVAGAAIVSGEPILSGSVVGIAVTAYNSGDTATVWLAGKHLVSKAAEAWPTVGTKVYWDSANNNFTITTSGTTTFAGYTASVQQAGDAQGQIILRQ